MAALVVAFVAALFAALVAEAVARYLTLVCNITETLFEMLDKLEPLPSDYVPCNIPGVLETPTHILEVSFLEILFLPVCCLSTCSS
jgi:hypothetical protein